MGEESIREKGVGKGAREKGSGALTGLTGLGGRHVCLREATFLGQPWELATVLYRSCVD